MKISKDVKWQADMAERDGAKKEKRMCQRKVERVWKLSRKSSESSEVESVPPYIQQNKNYSIV